MDCRRPLPAHRMLERGRVRSAEGDVLTFTSIKTWQRGNEVRDLGAYVIVITGVLWDVPINVIQTRCQRLGLSVHTRQRIPF